MPPYLGLCYNRTIFLLRGYIMLNIFRRLFQAEEESSEDIINTLFQKFERYENISEMPEVADPINVTPAVAAKLMEAKLILANTRIDNLRTYHQQLVNGGPGPDSAHAVLEAVGIELALLVTVIPLYRQLLPHSKVDVSPTFETKLKTSAAQLKKSIFTITAFESPVHKNWDNNVAENGYLGPVKKAEYLQAILEPATSLHQQLSKWLSKAKSQLNSSEGVEITVEKGEVDRSVNSLNPPGQ